MRRIIDFGLGVAGAAINLRVALHGRPTGSVDEQVRSGLADPVAGWWVRSVLDEFEYLISDFGYVLHEVHMYFKGNSISYHGPIFDVVIDYDPEATRSISAELWVVADRLPTGTGTAALHPRAFDVNDLLRLRAPTLDLPETMPARLDRDHVSDAVATWARELRDLAPDVLSGAWPEGVPVIYLW